DEGEAPDGDTEAPAPPQPTQQPKFVPHAAFHEERSRRQQLEAENRRLSEERARFDERLRVIQEMQERERSPPPEKPQWAVDPIAAGESLEQRLERLEQNDQHWREQQRQQTEAAQIEELARYDAARFAQAMPDYQDAYRYWYNSRANELIAQGLSPEEVPAKLIGEERQIIQYGAQRRVSPASTIYDMAKARGYAGRAAARNGAGNGNAAEHIERVATGQSRSPTLSGTGGGAASVKMTAEQLLSMSNDDFDAWTNKNPAATARLMG